MSSGLRYETGRDMPPGMAEKVAVQIIRRLEAAAPTSESDNTYSTEGNECPTKERREGT